MQPIEKGLQNSSLYMSVFCSLWLLLLWVIALLSALMEGDVGITHMYKAKHIFNSFATPGLKTLSNKASMWNLIQLRLRPAIGSRKHARFCRQQIHGVIQLLRAWIAPQWPQKNLGSKTAFAPALRLLLQAVSDGLRIRVRGLWYFWCGERNARNKEAGPPSVWPEAEAAESKNQESGS